MQWEGTENSWITLSWMEKKKKLSENPSRGTSENLHTQIDMQIPIHDSRLFWKNNNNLEKLETCTQRNLFEILLNQPEIRLYLPFSDWFRVNLIRFRKDFSVCTFAHTQRYLFRIFLTHFFPPFQHLLSERLRLSA